MSVTLLFKTVANDVSVSVTRNVDTSNDTDFVFYVVTLEQSDVALHTSRVDLFYDAVQKHAEYLLGEYADSLMCDDDDARLHAFL